MTETETESQSIGLAKVSRPKPCSRPYDDAPNLAFGSSCYHEFIYGILVPVSLHFLFHPGDLIQEPLKVF